MSRLFARWKIAALCCGLVSGTGLVSVTDAVDANRARSTKALKRFHCWLLDQGCLTNNIDIRSQNDHSQNFGIYERWNRSLGSFFSRKECLASFPCEVALTSQTVQQNNDLGEAFTRLVSDKRLSRGIPLVVYLIIHRALKETSQYLEWIQMLPNTFDIGLLFSTEQLKELRGTPLFELVCMAQRVVHRDWQILLDNGITQLFLDLGIEDKPCYEDYLWAVGVVWSRALELPVRSDKEVDLALVPGLDFLNHSLEPSCYWDVRHEDSKCQIELRKTPGINSNAKELTISYGEKTNSELLLSYGFTLDFNLHENITIILPFARDTNKKHNKTKLLEYFSLMPMLSLPMVPQETIFALKEKESLNSLIELIPGDVWSVLAICALSDKQAKNILSILERNKQQETHVGVELIPEKDTLSGIQLLKKLLEDQLDQLEGPNGTGKLENDILLLEQLQLVELKDSWLRDCFVYRSLQKKIIRDWIKVIALVVKLLEKQQ